MEKTDWKELLMDWFYLEGGIEEEAKERMRRFFEGHGCGKEGAKELTDYLEICIQVFTEDTWPSVHDESPLPDFCKYLKELVDDRDLRMQVLEAATIKLAS